MKATELRIGNTVMSYGKEQKICAADFAVFQMYEAKGELPPYVPVELNDEKLLLYGFKKDDSGVEMDDPDYCEWYEKEFPIIGELCQSSDKSYLFDVDTDTIRIKYVHQLQNLYFALTGEELTVK